jgi:hypothetical protein
VILLLALAAVAQPIEAQPIFTCGFQPADALFCVDHYGRLITPTAEDRRVASAQRMVCARPASDHDPNDPALDAFMREGSSREDAMERLTEERINGCDPEPKT